MAKVFIEETTLTNIGNAIRDKEGSSALIPVTDMATRIAAISGGGGGAEPPESAFNVRQDCSYRFYGGKWDWFITMYGDKITTDDISTCFYMFTLTTLEEIPFTIDVSPNCDNMGSMFQHANNLKVCPKIRSSWSHYNPTALSCDNMLEYCYNIRDFEDLFNDTFCESFSSVVVSGQWSSPKFPKFKNCYSIRQVPSWFYKFRISPDSPSFPYYYYTVYPYLFQNCFALDEATDIPVLRVDNDSVSTNMFDSTFTYCKRLKNFTFETDNGTPYVVKWKSQRINLSMEVGYSNYGGSADIFQYNSGITEDKRVWDDVNYQVLKDDPDWYSTEVAYSRYNHDSAVATINSLPDTSQFLLENGGVNEIIFKGASGSATDGGAINTLTEAEIAVAASKGWTVIFE